MAAALDPSASVPPSPRSSATANSSIDALSVRWKENTLLVRDASYKTEEEDDPLDAVIVFLAPIDVDTTVQAFFPSNIAALADACDHLGLGSPTVVHLGNIKAAIINTPPFTLLLTGSLFEADQVLMSQLRHIVEAFEFYHGSIQRVKEANRLNRNHFSSHMTRVMARIFAHVRPPLDLLKASFTTIPRYNPPAADQRGFLQASALSSRVMQMHEAPLGTCVIYKDKLVTSNLPIHIINFVFAMLKASTTATFEDVQLKRLQSRASRLRRLMQTGVKPRNPSMPQRQPMSPRRHLSSRRRAKHFFPGADFLDFLVASGEVSSRQEAFDLATKLLTKGLIVSLDNSAFFDDPMYSYCFQEDATLGSRESTAEDVPFQEVNESSFRNDRRNSSFSSRSSFRKLSSGEIELRLMLGEGHAQLADRAYVVHAFIKEEDISSMRNSLQPPVQALQHQEDAAASFDSSLVMIDNDIFVGQSTPLPPRIPEDHSVQDSSQGASAEYKQNQDEAADVSLSDMNKLDLSSSAAKEDPSKTYSRSNKYSLTTELEHLSILDKAANASTTDTSSASLASDIETLLEEMGMLRSDAEILQAASYVTLHQVEVLLAGSEPPERLSLYVADSEKKAFSGRLRSAMASFQEALANRKGAVIGRAVGSLYVQFYHDIVFVALYDREDLEEDSKQSLPRDLKHQLAVCAKFLAASEQLQDDVKECPPQAASFSHIERESLMCTLDGWCGPWVDYEDRLVPDDEVGGDMVKAISAMQDLVAVHQDESIDIVLRQGSETCTACHAVYGNASYSRLRLPVRNSSTGDAAPFDPDYQAAISDLHRNTSTGNPLSIM